MSNYTEEDIDRIIQNAEQTLNAPSDVEFISSGEVPLPKIVEIKKPPENVKLTKYLNEQTSNTDEYFETCFNKCKENKINRNNQLPEINDYSGILSSCTSHTSEKADPETAMYINSLLRNRLVKFRESIEASLVKINDRLDFLKNTLEKSKSNDAKDSMSFRATYVKCGRPYFKDALFYPAPENSDFKYRKDVLKELFPFALPSSNVKWTTKQKVDLVNAIKCQMIDYIKLQQSKKVCMETKTRGKMQKLRFISRSQDWDEMTISDLYNTIQNDYSDFQINWNLISFDKLQSSHTVHECMGMWFSYLRPDINRDPFTEDENETISCLAIENNYQNWNEIAQQLDRRTSLQTFSYFQTEFRVCPSNVRWTKSEDQLLYEAINKCTSAGIIFWNKVCSYVPNRSKTQCYNRYLVLNKSVNLKKGVFSAKENRILLDFVEKYGADFNKMPTNLLPERSLTQIKYHYNVALKHKGKVNPWTTEEDEQLMEFVENQGTNNWTKIADLLGTHNRLSCRTRYLTISKFLKKNPNKTIKDVPSRLKTITAVQKADLNDSDSSNKEEETKSVVKTERNSKSFGAMTFDQFRLKYSLLYNLMRPAYGYTLNLQELDFDYSRFLFFKSLLNIEHYGLQRKFSFAFTPVQYTKINEALSTNLDTSLEAEIIHSKYNSNFLVPLNYHTAVGLRSVAIKMSEDSVDETERRYLYPETEEYIANLVKFQKLFKSLFYWPAMMSKLSTTELISMKNTRQVASFPSTSNFIIGKRPAERKVYESFKKIKFENEKIIDR